MRRLLCAVLSIAACACDDRPRPWSGTEGPAAVLEPPPTPAEPPSASGEAPPTVASATGTVATAVAQPADEPAEASDEPPRPRITPGGGWVRCSEGLGLSGDPRKDVTRLGLLCGPSNGMRRKTRQAIVGVISADEPPVVTPLRVARGACYRVLAAADGGVEELDVTVRSSRDVAVAGDHTAGRLAVVQADRPFCAPADDVFSLEVAAKRGSGRFAAEVWSIGEGRRKDQADEPPVDEAVDKP